MDFIKSRQFILKKAGPLRGDTLELGTGRGYTTLALAKAGYKFISVDKDRETLKTAALNLAYEDLLSSVDFYIMDAKTMAFKSGSFKNVVCVNLFHHVTAVNEMLSEIDRVLRVYGKAVLADFNENGMEIVNGVHRQESHVHEDTGVTKEDIYSYFFNLGYEIEDYDDRCHWVLICRKLIQK